MEFLGYVFEEPNSESEGGIKTFIGWNVFLVLDTLSQYIWLFAITTSLSYGVVTPWVALPMGTLTAVIFIVAAAVKKCDDDDWNGYVVVANFWYWVGGLLAVITDIILRFATPELFCDATIDDCDAQFKALTVFWSIFAVFAVVWFYFIRKMYIWVNNRTHI